jgi:hypothetical protein
LLPFDGGCDFRGQAQRQHHQRLAAIGLEETSTSAPASQP